MLASSAPCSATPGRSPPGTRPASWITARAGRSRNDRAERNDRLPLPGTPGELPRRDGLLRARPEAVADRGVDAGEPAPLPARLGHRLGLRAVLRSLPGQGAAGYD